MSEERTYTGLSLASITLGVIGIVLSASTWAAWIFVVHLTRRGAMIQPVPAQPTYSFADLVVAYVVGALWFVTLPMAVLAALFGWLDLLRAPAGMSGHLARVGAGIGVLTLLLSLAGAALFSYKLSSPPPPVFTPYVGN